MYNKKSTLGNILTYITNSQHVLNQKKKNKYKNTQKFWHPFKSLTESKQTNFINTINKNTKLLLTLNSQLSLVPNLNI